MPCLRGRSLALGEGKEKPAFCKPITQEQIKQIEPEQYALKGLVLLYALLQLF